MDCLFEEKKMLKFKRIKIILQVPTIVYLDIFRNDFYRIAFKEVENFLLNDNYCADRPNVINLTNLSLIEGDYQTKANQVKRFKVFSI